MNGALYCLLFRHFLIPPLAGGLISTGFAVLVILFPTPGT
jgi:hypothetical protein